MDVSSTGSSSVAIDAMKKTMDVKERQVMQILEGATEQSQKMTAQKTGMGNSLNISA